MKILNISYAIPSLKVSNQDLLREVMERSRKHLSFADLKKLEKRVKTFFRMSGTDTRYHRNAGERALDFALSAGKKLSTPPASTLRTSISSFTQG